MTAQLIDIPSLDFRGHVGKYLIWAPLIPICIAHVTEQVLEEAPCGVACLEPQIDGERYRAYVRGCIVGHRGQPDCTTHTLHNDTHTQFMNE